LRAETAARPLALLQSSCGSDRQSWESMHVISAGCRRDEPFIKRFKCFDCEILHWAWQGVYGSALQVEGFQPDSSGKKT